MRALTKSERQLGAFLVGVMVLVGLALAAKWYLGESRRMSGEIVRLQAARQAYQETLAEKPFWEARDRWLSQNPPEIYRVSESESRFVEDTQRQINEQGLSIEKQELHESEREGGLALTVIDIDARAPLEKIVRWLRQVQQPGRFCMVQSLNLKRVDETASMLARVRLAKVHQEAP